MPSESKDPPWNLKIEVGQLEDAIAPARDLQSLLVSHKRNCSSERACGQSKVTKNSAAEQRKIVSADWNCTSSPKALSPPLPNAHLCMSQHPLFRPFPRRALQAFLGSSSGPLTWSGFPSQVRQQWAKCRAPWARRSRWPEGRASSSWPAVRPLWCLLKETLKMYPPEGFK